ncbi:hypothetical protein HZC35_03250 [Candidatus Saganbacteria bacterium]|nr:hypothetical protein [Candidatus Saganbacteria bacterium]
MVSFTVADILIEADGDLTERAHLSLKKHLDFVNKYLPEIEKAPLFAPRIIRDIRWAAGRARAKPLEVLDGALLDRLAHDLLRYSKELAMEKGVNHFLRVRGSRRLKLSDKLAIEIDAQDTPCGICVRPGVVVISPSGALASSAAAALLNFSIEEGLKKARKIKGLSGILIYQGEQMGISGKIKLHAA